MIEDKVLEAELEMQQIWQALHNKQLSVAAEKSQNLCRQLPEYGPAWFVSSVVALEKGQLDTAMKHVELALTLVANVDPWNLHLAKVCLLSGKKSRALELANTLLESSDKKPSFQAELGLLFNKLGAFEEALICYQNAVNSQTNNAQLWFNLASIQRYLGKLKDAKTSLDRLIELDPTDSEAWLLRSSLNKQKANNNHLDGLKIAVQHANRPLAKAQLQFAMGKELEDLARFDEAFEVLHQAAQTRRANMQYSLDNDLAVLQSIRRVYNSSVLNSSTASCDNDQAIFILGLPRTGSTLVERIVANHSEVYSAGELNNFALVMMQQVKQILATPPKDKLALIEATKNLNFSQLGQDYINSTRPETSQHAKFIDKLPLNSLYVGLIHLALPKAKVIYVKRHPLDTFFAIFKHCFTQGYPFSYDLDELCSYQIEHHKLMQHWQAELGSKLYTIEYERLVQNLEDETRKLLEYCDLSWQAECCQFEKNNAATTTASAAQVRQGIYSSSIGKWKHFEQQLSAVKKRFEDAGIKCA